MIARSVSVIVGAAFGPAGVSAYAGAVEESARAVGPDKPGGGLAAWLEAAEFGLFRLGGFGSGLRPKMV